MMASNSNKMDSNVVKSVDTYEERISDELSEVILQYLSLEDKLRLECVSQQFRRTLFTKHYSLGINNKMSEISIESIEKFVKKFHNLCEIQSHVYNSTLNSQFIKSLIKTTNNLRKIEFFNTNCISNPNCDCDDLTLSKVIHKYGLSLVSLEYCPNFDKKYLSQLSNIKELDFKYYSDLNVYHFRRLKSLKFFKSIDFKHLEVLIENNRNTLKHLYIIGYTINEEITERLSTSISKLKSLIDFEITNELTLTELKELSQNCNQLKRIGFWFDIKEDNSFADLLSSLKGFKALKRLEVNTYFKSGLSDNEKNNLLSFSTFKSTLHLTHFEINLNNFFVINENIIFKDFENKFPKLQSLIIDGIVIECSEYTTHIMSRFSDLKKIRLTVTKDSPKYEIETKLKEKLKRITTIHIVISPDFDNYGLYTDSDSSSI